MMFGSMMMTIPLLAPKTSIADGILIVAVTIVSWVYAWWILVSVVVIVATAVVVAVAAAKRFWIFATQTRSAVPIPVSCSVTECLPSVRMKGQSIPYNARSMLFINVTFSRGKTARSIFNHSRLHASLLFKLLILHIALLSMMNDPPRSQEKEFKYKESSVVLEQHFLQWRSCETSDCPFQYHKTAVIQISFKECTKRFFGVCTIKDGHA